MPARQNNESNNCMTAAHLSPDHTFIAELTLGGSGPKVAVKDCLDIKGTVTTCGSAVLKEAAPAQDHAEIVEHLLAKGFQIIGKTNMHEFAYGITGINHTFGTPINPKWPDRTPGGSSSGSAAAVAQNLCDFSIGTDTGGSVRQPAICCGIYGIKPTFGRVSRVGCYPAVTSLDCIGVFTRSAAELSGAMAAIDPTFREIAPFEPQLGFVPSFELIDEPLIYQLMGKVGSDTRLSLAERDLPNFLKAFEAGLTAIGREASNAYGAYLRAGSSSGDLGEDVRTRLEGVTNITDEELAAAEQVRALFSSEVDRALEGVDALITPALPIIPPKLSEASDALKLIPQTRFLRPFNLSGHPALVLPISVGHEKLPSGIQLVGRKGEDEKLCALATWLDENWRY